MAGFCYSTHSISFSFFFFFSLSFEGIAVAYGCVRKVAKNSTFEKINVRNAGSRHLVFQIHGQEGQ